MLAALESATGRCLLLRLKIHLLLADDIATDADVVGCIIVISATLHRRDRVVLLHGQVIALVLGRRSLVLRSGLDTVSVVVRHSHSLDVLRRPAGVLHIHHEAASCELLVRLICQLVDELGSIFVNLPEVGIQIEVMLALVKDYRLT